MKLIPQPLMYAILVFLSLNFSCSNNKIKDYPIQPVPFTSILVNDNFWSPMIKRNHEITIPIALKQCEITGRIRNFKIAGKLEKGKFCTSFPFDDSDIYKIIEGASYSLQIFPDKKLEAYIDTLISLISIAQEPDGYLYTNRTIDPGHTHEWAGNKRWVNDPKGSHELYNLGHLYEAATAHYAATGKKNLMDIAIKSANLVEKEFGEGKLTYFPGHQVIEMGLVKLYKATREEKYLKLARFFLDTRGPGGEEYNQSHLKIFDQDKIVGHAVRATYMYAGMADIAALYNDKKYSKPLFKIWDDLLSTKYYITGGIGSSGTNEGFSQPYDLPNLSAYCETCASIGLVYWNYRMFLLTGESKYFDVLERTLYNALISGVSISGDHFFYPNVLESRGQQERSEWFGCACCPGNICRFLPSMPGYIYAQKDDVLYVNLYISNIANLILNGTNLKVEQQANAPWDGKIKFTVFPEKEKTFTVKFRVPSWYNGQPVPSNLYSFTKQSKSNIEFSINGKLQNQRFESGYVSITRTWEKGDKVEFELPMDIRIINANPKIKDNIGKISLQKGPLVYCLEGPDNNGKVINKIVDTSAGFTSQFDKNKLNGIMTIQGKAKSSELKNGKIETSGPSDFIAIPYYAWANRSPEEMTVWIATTPEASKPIKPATIASTSKIKASDTKSGIGAINDSELPQNSNDPYILNFTWWPKKNSIEWIEYTFQKPEKISESSVYWFDDGPHGGCRIPASWKVYFKQNNEWKPVLNKETYLVEKDKLNTIHFETIHTTAMKLEFTLQKDYSGGLYEWIIK